MFHLSKFLGQISNMVKFNLNFKPRVNLFEKKKITRSEEWRRINKFYLQVVECWITKRVVLIGFFIYFIFFPIICSNMMRMTVSDGTWKFLVWITKQISQPIFVLLLMSFHTRSVVPCDIKRTRSKSKNDIILPGIDFGQFFFYTKKTKSFPRIENTETDLNNEIWN